MTDDDGRKILAERIMGWRYDGETYAVPVWCKLDGWFCEATAWKPEEDAYWAMEVAEALRLEHGWEYVITAITPRQAGWTTNKGPFNFRLYWFGRSAEEFRTRQIRYNSYEAKADTLERAIFLAAAQAAEAMEGQE